jgi:hypothetical protein
MTNWLFCKLRTKATKHRAESVETAQRSLAQAQDELNELLARDDEAVRDALGGLLKVKGKADGND